MSFPEILILEMGVDKPGDMDYLISIARPDISIITNIGLSHYEFFKDSQTLEKEKGKLALALNKDGLLIVNADNNTSLAQKLKTKSKSLSYGLNQVSDIKITNIEEDLSQALQGVFTSFLVKTPTQNFKAVTQTLGIPHISAIAAAITVGEYLNINKEDIKKGIKEYKPTPGRLNVIAGIKKTVIIDDTYNAAPDSTKAALALLSKFPQPIKFAILGDMLELGSITDQEHIKIGELVAYMGLNKFITIGPNGKTMAKSAQIKGMDSRNILSFDNSSQALNAIQNMLIPGSVILIKGSQGMRMEKITKEIMAEPMRAEELLCRQYGKWIS